MILSAERTTALQFCPYHQPRNVEHANKSIIITKKRRFYTNNCKHLKIFCRSRTFLLSPHRKPKTVRCLHSSTTLPSSKIKRVHLQQEALLSKTSSCHLRDSLYGFKTYEGNSWLLEYDVHHTPVQPDMAAVNAIKRNGTQLRVRAKNA